MLYELDEVERPTDAKMADDDALDTWYKGFRSVNRQKLVEYHKKDSHVDKGVPNSKWSRGKK